MDRYRKFLVAIAAGLTTLAVAASGGITGAEWWLVLAAIGGPLGVYAIRNEPPTEN